MEELHGGIAMVCLGEFLMSNLIVSFDHLVIRPETLGKNIYTGNFEDMPIMVYKMYKNRGIKRIEFTKDVKDTIIIVVYDEEENK